MKKSITLIHDDGTASEHQLPARHEVCPRCEGHGTHLTPSIGQHAYTGEEFMREFDEEGREEYFKRGGIYDVRCELCDGKRVVEVVDEQRLNVSQKVVHAEWERQQEERRREEAEDLRTRYYEEGGWLEH